MLTKNEFLTKSLKIIQANQFPSGAYIASPAFSHYRYSWLRDGTFIAYAMDRLGQHESAKAFYGWCNQVILAHETKARTAIAAVQAGEAIVDANLFLHTRYTVDGEEVEGEWGNFQLDGYGTWLWGLAEHVRLSGDATLITAYQRAIDITLDYLVTCWQLPNYDCWEEFPDRVHPASLASIYGGCKAIASHRPERAEELDHLCTQIRLFVLEKGVGNGLFTKSIGDPAVDASLLWLSVPFGLVDVSDPQMKQTVCAIEQEIVHGCGVHRYPTDVYYGGGQWILLSAWLGWYYVQVGEYKKATDILAWIESKFTQEGLPEQVNDTLLAPKEYDTWLKQAGEPAHPLLWSHAMYLVLISEIATTGQIS